MDDVNKKIALINEATQFLDELEAVEKQVKVNQRTTERKTDSRMTRLAVVVLVAALICAGFVVYKVIAWFNAPSDDDYVTYYVDENGNGQLDQGEGNYTVDEDGNVVDTDEDLNNFE